MTITRLWRAGDGFRIVQAQVGGDSRM